jgi:hypothetical protein
MMIMMTRAQPTLRTPPRRDGGSGQFDLDAADLSATLRELAMRAHQLVRTTDAPKREHELTEVLGRIIQLQRSLDQQELGSLATYVSALRQRVEERLA